MISLYLEQTPLLVNAMKRSFLDNDWISLQSAAHKMIPSFAIMGINQDFENMARKVQEYASIQQQSDGMYDIVLQIENVCIQACKELKSEFNRIKKIKMNKENKIKLFLVDDDGCYLRLWRLTLCSNTDFILNHLQQGNFAWKIYLTNRM